MQFLRQEAHSLKEELKIARMVFLFLFLVNCIVTTTESLLFFFTRTLDFPQELHTSVLEKQLIVAEICGCLLICPQQICHSDYKTVF